MFLHHLFPDLLVVFHLEFVAFVLFGGLLVLRWRWVAWLHVPSAIWGAWIEFAGWVCPLTPLENWLRGSDRYQGGFVEHYLLPLLYPSGLPQGASRVFGPLVVGINLAVYAVVIARSGFVRGRRAQKIRA